MRAAGVMEAAIGAFRHNYEALCRDESGLIAEESLEPATELPQVELGEGGFDPELLAQTVVIKLNGGLGTSMGLEKVKSLLEVRPGVTFLDLIVRQIRSLRESTGSPVRLLFMNSFATSDDTLGHLADHAPVELAERSEVELMQNQAPKIDAETLMPATCEAHPELEWCPPGHGDLYPALLGSGWLDRLLDAGVKYAFVSNSDNLGAVLDPALLRWFAESEAPFMMEVTRRTPADRKGGHLARRRSDGRLLLREVAQCPDEDLDSFQDIERHRYFNTNSIWLRLDRLKERLEQGGGVLPLPMIRNRKTVDPRDKASTAVIQLETAMGAAIECFEGATAVEVPRSRFAPVKTTGDLLALRSDAYQVDDRGTVLLDPRREGRPPVVKLDDGHKFVDSLDALGVPSLIGCDSLVVEGDIRFADGVVIQGSAEFSTGEGVKEIPAGVYPKR
ncbi:UDP-N-acetylglucosamine pyrophosphorylase [Haloferula luteola]|uniref:UDP-N-acetylglucosamine pyrophosphorylase n=1 Tax=Haloferula luteola TaxID=595692 RepID=A0A840V046_9BACT|nr:UTP--glucose-1-phosphate uridylyltransferase [Haloferula luteola]MBB5350643.1 UDP-N-acetylglucosamine pyrophosphorylase [Haloferula luteola]